MERYRELLADIIMRSFFHINFNLHTCLSTQIKRERERETHRHRDTRTNVHLLRKQNIRFAFKTTKFHSESESERPQNIFSHQTN